MGNLFSVEKPTKLQEYEKFKKCVEYEGTSLEADLRQINDEGSNKRQLQSFQRLSKCAQKVSPNPTKLLSDYIDAEKELSDCKENQSLAEDKLIDAAEKGNFNVPDEYMDGLSNCDKARTFKKINSINNVINYGSSGNNYFTKAIAKIGGAETALFALFIVIFIVLLVMILFYKKYINCEAINNNHGIYSNPPYFI
jgi:hypothetical protein